MTTASEALASVKYWVGCFTWIISFSHDSPKFYNCLHFIVRENEVLERLSILPNITQLLVWQNQLSKFNLTPKLITLTNRVLRGTHFHIQIISKEKDKYIRKDEALGSQRESLMKRWRRMGVKGEENGTVWRNGWTTTGSCCLNHSVVYDS